MDKNTKMLCERLPEYMQEKIYSLPEYIISCFEEIRISTYQDTLIIYNNTEISLNDGSHVKPDLLEEILDRLLDYSYYAYEEELSKGYMTIKGGHRVGICGRVTLKEGDVYLIKDISSLNIRRSRELIGISGKILDLISDIKTGNISNTLIISPPKCGKTTLIRDIARSLSYQGFRVGICDERSEIAGCFDGIPSYDLGPRTDILDCCPKAKGMIMLIRSMSPDVIITDEIGRPEDVYAIEESLNAGVKIITTIHGRTYEDVVFSSVGKLIKNNTFDNLLFLTSTPSTGTVSRIMKLNNNREGI